MPTPIIVCADIGSFAQSNFGWWSSKGEEGTLPSTLAEHLADMLDDGQPVALGFECPLFVPIPKDELQLGQRRSGENSSPWSAGAGCAVLATGLVQVTWVLDAVRKKLKKSVRSFLDWEQFQKAESGLFLWEAFVSGEAKSSKVEGRNEHIEDAKTGAKAFEKASQNPSTANAIACESDVYSLIGAALLRTKWSTDIHILSKACWVIKAQKCEQAF